MTYFEYRGISGTNKIDASLSEWKSQKTFNENFLNYVRSHLSE